MPEIYERKESKDIAKSRSWLNYLAKKSVENKDLHVVLTLTKAVAFTVEKPKELPLEKHGANLIFQRRFLRPDKQHLAIKKVEAERKSLDERAKDFKAQVKKLRASAKQRISEGHNPSICRFEYDKDIFIQKAKDFLAEFKTKPLAMTHEYVRNKALAMTHSEADIKARHKRLIDQAFRPLTDAAIRKLRNYREWKVKEGERLDERAKFYNHQVDFWNKRIGQIGSKKHRIHVRRYEGLYGEPYYYNRRDVYIPKHAFCDVFPEPYK